MGCGCDPEADASPWETGEDDAGPDAAQAAPDAAEAHWDADCWVPCGEVGQPCCTENPLRPCDPGLTCGVPPQDHCIPVAP